MKKKTTIKKRNKNQCPKKTLVNRDIQMSDWINIVRILVTLIEIITN